MPDTLVKETDKLIYRTLYISRATRPLIDLEVEDLASRAAIRNETESITGLLLFDGRRFMQAIEGDQAAVESLMSRIVSDTRHDMIAIMSSGHGNRRKFGDWSLAYKRVGEDCCTTGYLHKVKNHMASVANPELQAAFIGFAKLAYADDPINGQKQNNKDRPQAPSSA